LIRSTSPRGNRASASNQHQIRHQTPDISIRWTFRAGSWLAIDPVPHVESPQSSVLSPHWIQSGPLRPTISSTNQPSPQLQSHSNHRKGSRKIKPRGSNYHQFLLEYYGYMFSPIRELSSSRIWPGQFGNFLPRSQTFCPVREPKKSSRTGQFSRTKLIVQRIFEKKKKIINIIATTVYSTPITIYSAVTNIYSTLTICHSHLPASHRRAKIVEIPVAISIIIAVAVRLLPGAGLQRPRIPMAHDALRDL
jgi:hypothetical protein